MNCTEIENNLAFFIENSLAKNKMTDIQNHLSECKNCTELYQKMKADFLFIGNDKISEINPFFYNRLTEQLQNKESGKTSLISLKTRHIYIQAAAYAAGIILAIFLGIGLGADFNINNDFVIEDVEEVTEYQMFADSYHMSQSDEYTYELQIAEDK